MSVQSDLHRTRCLWLFRIWEGSNFPGAEQAPGAEPLGPVADMVAQYSTQAQKLARIREILDSTGGIGTSARIRKVLDS